MAASPAGGRLFTKPSSSRAIRSESVNAWVALPDPAEGRSQAGPGIPHRRGKTAAGLCPPQTPGKWHLSHGQ